MKQQKARYTSLNFFIFAFIGLSLTACTQPADDPKMVADQYWQFIQTGNAVEAEKLVSLKSRPAYAENNSHQAAIDSFSNDGTVTTVSTTITTTNPLNNLSHTQTFDTYLVLQQGQWKIDASQTQRPASPNASEEELRQLAEELSESMQDNIDSIDEAMNQGMQMLNEALRDGSKEMGDSLLKLMNELNNSMHDSIDKMKQRREQNTPQKQSDPQNGEGKI